MPAPLNQSTVLPREYKFLSRKKTRTRFMACGAYSGFCTSRAIQIRGAGPVCEANPGSFGVADHSETGRPARGWRNIAIALIDEVGSEICLQHSPERKSRDASDQRFWPVPHTDPDRFCASRRRDSISTLVNPCSPSRRDFLRLALAGSSLPFMH